MDGQTTQFLHPVSDLWMQSAARPQNIQLPRPSPCLCAPVMLHGANLDMQVGVFLLAREMHAFPPPLATSSVESLSTGERDRHTTQEMYSGFSTLLSLESLLHQLSLLSDLATTISSTVMCSQLLPLVRSAIWQMTPSTSEEVGCAMSSHMACWRQAVTLRLPAAQSALLLADPFSYDFGSAQAVTDALAQAPQLMVVYHGRGSARPALPRDRSVAALRKPVSCPPSVPWHQRTKGRFHPYASRFGRPYASS